MAGALVGRAAQLAVAQACLDDLARGRGGLLVLTGEPGIGKTRLAEEVMALARAEGARAVWASAWPGEGTPPLWSWVQVLREVAGSEGALDSGPVPSPGASPAALFAQSQAVVGAIREAAARQPLLVVLDDLHGVDAASVRVLTNVASAVRDVGCLLLGTLRTGEVAREQVAELARVGRTVAVPPLTDEEAARLLEASAPGVSETATAAVLRQSHGNPLFVWEFGQLMASTGRLDVAPAAVPEAVAAVIERRVARISESTVDVLRVAAVVGATFSTDLIAQIGQIDGDVVRKALAEARAAGLVVGDRFGHDLVRDVVADGIDPRLHARAAEAFAALVAGDPALHAVVAGHLDQAGPAYAPEAAREWEFAAHQARRMLAYDEAAACFARAARGAPDDRKRASLLADEGECGLLAGDLDTARARFRASAELARAVPDPRTMTRAALGVGTGPVAWEVPIADAGQISLLVDALELLPREETQRRAMLLARLSVAAARPETMALARERAEEALRLAQQCGEPGLVAQALAAVNDALAGPEHTMTRRDNADMIVELAADDAVLALLGYRFRIVADLELGDLATVDRDIAEFGRLAQRVRHPLVSWYVPLFRGMRALLAGDVDAADRHEREVTAAAQETGSDNAAMLGMTLRIGIDAARGVPTDPRLVEGMTNIDPAEWASLAAIVALARLRAGDVDGGRAVFAPLAADGFAGVGDDSERVPTLAYLSRVAAALGDRRAAERLYELLAPYAPLWAVDGIAAVCLGPVEMELGRLALALDRPDVARAHLTRAHDVAQRAGAALVVAEIAGLAPTLERPAATTGHGNEFRREGQFWTLTYHGRTVRMRDAKGLHDLARLLAEPGREVHVFDLVGVPADAEGAAVRAQSGIADLLDARARAEYRRRLAELEDELAEADRFADVGRAERAGGERDFILAELAGALGLAGRARRVADPVERARKAVTARIRLAIGRIDADHPALARHLDNAVRTGTTCAYRPETPTSWRL